MAGNQPEVFIKRFLLKRCITGPCFQLITLQDTESLPTLPLRLLGSEKGYARSVEQNEKRGDLIIIKRVPFLTKLHFLRILL